MWQDHSSAWHTTKRTRASPGARVATPTPTDVQLQADLQAAIFLSETGLMLEEATGQVEAEIPVAPVLTPFQHGKPFVTEEEEKSLGTQMFNLHRWYLRMSNDQGKMFGVKYRDHDFFRREEDFWVYFENLYHIYHRQALDASIITILGFVSITYLYINTFC